MLVVLHYFEFGLSHIEVPGESALCIYMAGCLNKCTNCHYKELQQADEGEALAVYFEKMLDLYHEYISCVCFLGEGDSSKESQEELLKYVKISNNRGYKTCLYSGRDTDVEEWMKRFDYVKVGSYQEELGPLTSKTTNQRMWMKDKGQFKDITERFW